MRSGTTKETHRFHGRSSSESYEVSKILDCKVVSGTKLYLIRWKGFDATEDSWEPASNLQCPLLVAKFERRRRDQHSCTSGICIFCVFSAMYLLRNLVRAKERRKSAHATAPRKGTTDSYKNNRMAKDSASTIRQRSSRSNATVKVVSGGAVNHGNPNNKKGKCNYGAID
ncbi:unnamed protein product [Soboliphyme baturini]|uniref:Chromo domain-containing protein n=1 Tax=Soboliphyme baturini TaxID=241478 RepID=A0A183JA84_9BILA|nr:unnamed protein product [Soboliphyme baturini]